MENKNKTVRGFPTQIFTKVLALFALTITFAACGNKGGGSGTNTNNGLVVSNCSSCSSISNPISIGSVQATSMAIGAIPQGAVQLNLNLYVNGNQFVPGSSSSYNLYNGPAALQGKMVVGSTWYYDYSSTCRIPVGTYDVQTTSVTSMGDAGLIPSMELLATSGSNKVRLVISQGMLLNFNAYYGSGAGYRLYSGIGVSQVNGYSCPSNFGMNFN